MWQRHVQRPPGSRQQGAKCGRLGIVDDDEIVVALETLGEAAVGRQERLAGPSVEADIHALEAVMDALGDVEESLVAGDDAPLGLEPDIEHEGGQSGQELGDAATEAGGIDVEDAGPAEGFGQAPDLVDGLVAGDWGIGGQGERRDMDQFEHRAASPVERTEGPAG